MGEFDDVGLRDFCIFSYGFWVFKEDLILILVFKVFIGVGFSIYRFDFIGNGESDGEFVYGSYWCEVDDIRFVVNYWWFCGWWIIFLIGYSKGGNVVLLYVFKYGDVVSIVNMCGWFDLIRGMLFLGFFICFCMFFFFVEIFEVVFDLRF